MVQMKNTNTINLIWVSINKNDNIVKNIVKNNRNIFIFCIFFFFERLKIFEIERNIFFFRHVAKFEL